MPFRPAEILPKYIFAALKRGTPPMMVSPLLAELSQAEAGVALEKMQAVATGLTQEQAETRLQEYGPNAVGQEKHSGFLGLFARACLNPLVILLTILAVLSGLTGDYRAATVMGLMVLLGVVLRLVQEAKADQAAAKLKAMISVTATVLRDGQSREIPLQQIVPGDVVKLAAGDMIPADLRLLTCKDLFVIQSSLTGESLPVEKFEAVEAGTDKQLIERRNLCFLGTSVESGSATAVVLATGAQTYLGGMAKAIVGQQVTTSFDKGIN